MTKHGLWLAAATLIASAGVHAAPSEETWAKLNTAIIDNHVLPRYAKLAEEAKHLQTATNTLCQSPFSQDNLDEAHDAFEDAMEAWQGVQHIQFGPITLLMRNFSLEYWPDKKNIGGRQLKAALSEPDAQYDTEFFHAASVSLKGFPAIERLLFSKTAATELNPDTPHCRLAQGIANNIVWSVASVHDEWDTEAQHMAEVGEEEYYETHKDAATAFMKSLVEPFELIRDTKLLTPIADAPEKSRWRRSESWRSGLSIENIESNVDALHELYSDTGAVSVKSIFIDEGQKEMADRIDAEFDAVLEKIDALEEPNEQVSAEQYAAIKEVTDSLKQIQIDLDDGMKLLDVQLGFNSRDGD